jgi:hypothetical protein
MGTYNSTATFDGDPRHLLSVLTELDAIERWAPVPFDLLGGRDRLNKGDELVVEGGLLGRKVRFRVEVDRADQTGLSLRASGAFEIDVDYRIDSDAAKVSARIETRARKPLARLLAGAANAMLGAGALEHVLRRVIREAALAASRSGTLCLGM